MPPKLNIIISELSKLAVVETQLLLVDLDAEGKAGDKVHEEEDDAGDDEGPGETGGGAGELVAELDEVAVDPATLDGVAAVEVGDVGAAHFVRDF